MKKRVGGREEKGDRKRKKGERGGVKKWVGRGKGTEK